MLTVIFARNYFILFTFIILKAGVDNKSDDISQKTCKKDQNGYEQERINMQPAKQTTNENKIRWWVHVKRLAPTAPESKALVIQPEGRRSRGIMSLNRLEDVYENSTTLLGSRLQNSTTA